MSATHPIEGFLSGLVRQCTARPDTIASELENLQKVRRRTFSLIYSVSEKQGRFVPRPGSWSVVQVLDHVVLTEGLYKDAIRKLVDLAKAGKKPEITYTLKDIDVSLPVVPQAALAAIELPLNLLNRFIPPVVRQTVIRYPLLPATTPTVAAPGPDLSMATMRDRLLESAIQLGELLQKPLPANPREMTISHPILGFNNILDILGIMAAHEERHQGQIRNILNDPNLPAG
jgi:hypothetical protein